MLSHRVDVIHIALSQLPRSKTLPNTDMHKQETPLSPLNPTSLGSGDYIPHIDGNQLFPDLHEVWKMRSQLENISIYTEFIFDIFYLSSYYILHLANYRTLSLHLL